MRPINIEPYEIVVEHGARRRPPLWLLLLTALVWLVVSALTAVLAYRSSPRNTVRHATVVPMPRTLERRVPLRAHR